MLGEPHHRWREGGLILLLLPTVNRKDLEMPLPGMCELGQQHGAALYFPWVGVGGARAGLGAGRSCSYLMCLVALPQLHGSPIP